MAAVEAGGGGFAQSIRAKKNENAAKGRLQEDCSHLVVTSDG